VFLLFSASVKAVPFQNKEQQKVRTDGANELFATGHPGAVTGETFGKWAIASQSGSSRSGSMRRFGTAEGVLFQNREQQHVSDEYVTATVT
jgi:hypothetical protein